MKPHPEYRDTVTRAVQTVQNHDGLLTVEQFKVAHSRCLPNILWDCLSDCGYVAVDAGGMIRIQPPGEALLKEMSHERKV